MQQYATKIAPAINEQFGNSGQYWGSRRAVMLNDALGTTVNQATQTYSDALMNDRNQQRSYDLSRNQYGLAAAQTNSTLMDTDLQTQMLANNFDSVNQQKAVQLALSFLGAPQTATVNTPSAWAGLVSGINTGESLMTNTALISKMIHENGNNKGQNGSEWV